MGTVDKKLANYRKGDGATACAQCLHFLPIDKCESVSGIISPEAVCDMFQTENDVEDAMTNFMTGAPDGNF